MNLTEQLKALNEFDLADLDLDNMGGWPNALKATVMVLLFLLLLGAGFYWHIEDLNATGGCRAGRAKLAPGF